jgi:plastocyanin
MIKKTVYGLLFVALLVFFAGCNNSPKAQESPIKIPLGETFELSKGVVNEVHQQRVPEDHEVMITQSAFMPTSLKIKPGDSVTWISIRNETHKLVEEKGLFYSGNILRTKKHFTFIFDNPGTYSYHDVDTGATGEIIVK